MQQDAIIAQNLEKDFEQVAATPQARTNEKIEKI